MEANTDNRDMYQRQIPKSRIKNPYNDRSGLWVVKAATGETSSAVCYEAAGSIMGAWKKKIQYRGVKIWREKAE